MIMNKTHIIALTTAIFLIFGCTNKKTQLKDFDMHQYIISYFASPNGFDVDAKIRYKEIVTCLYHENQNEPFWFTDNQPNAQSEQLFDLLAHSMYYGLDTTLYNLLTITDFKQGLPQDSLLTNENKQSMLGYELCLTQSAILFFTHLHRGIMPFDPLSYITQEAIDSTSSYFKIYDYFDTVSQDSLVNSLYQALTTNNMKESVNLLQPQNIHYLSLQTALKEYVQNNPINQENIQIVYYEQDTAWTTTFDNYRKACLALQKLRWSNIRSTQYIFINIPSFTLDFVEENTLALTHKIVCGTTDKQTPELNSRLKHIELFPDWNIPFSIATKEILPMVKRNTEYLAKHNYEVLDTKGNLLDPDSVPWKKYTEKYLPVRIRQTSGQHNSLGIIKFYFENLSAVYFHDTPAKGLFNRTFRAYSHGCMRLQNAVTFAKKIMEFDNDILHLPQDQLVAMGIYETQKKKKGQYDANKYGNSAQVIFQNKLQEKEKHIYNVKKDLPIYIRYLTAYCNEDNQLCFTPDFYSRDSVLMLRYNEELEAIIEKWK